MFNCLYKTTLCNFGIAFGHAICVIAKYFGKLLLKTIRQPKSSPIFYHPGENRNLKSPNVNDLSRGKRNSGSKFDADYTG